METSAKYLFVHGEMFFFYMRIFFSLTPSRNKEAVPLTPTCKAAEMALVDAIQMENGESSALLPRMYGNAFNICGGYSKGKWRWYRM